MIASVVRLYSIVYNRAVAKAFMHLRQVLENAGNTEVSTSDHGNLFVER